MSFIREGELKNSPDARVYPGPGNHEALAEYWGVEAASSMHALDAGTSTNPDLDAEHAWRVSRMAWRHALTAKGLKDGAA